MGVINPSLGGNGRNGLVLLFGYQDSLSLDSRARFRLPDDLAGALQRELGRVQQESPTPTPPAAFQRLAFYFVPGTRKRVFLYPTPNIHLAVGSFENPPREMDPELIRRARDYFYCRMRFVEADKQNRLVIPEGLRQHADIDERVEHITLVAHNYWLALSRSELVDQTTQENLEPFEQAAADLLDPAHRPPAGSMPPQTDQPAAGG